MLVELIGACNLVDDYNKFSINLVKGWECDVVKPDLPEHALCDLAAVCRNPTCASLTFVYTFDS